MQVSVETGEGLERKLTITVAADLIDQKIESKLKNIASRVKMDGFRPGKVPMKVVRQQYLGEARSEVMTDVIESSYRDAIVQEKLRPAGMPSISDVKLDEGQPFGYVATLEVYPEVTVAAVDKLTIEKDVATVADADVDKMIETLCKQRVTWNEVDRASQDGDQMIVDFTGYIGDEAFDGGSANDIAVVIGSNGMIPGFEEQLVGLKKDQDGELNVTFPADYQATELAGKEARFEITVKKVSEPVVPELDAEMAKSLGVADGDVEKLKSDIRANMERELKNNVEGMFKARVMDAIVDGNEVLIPKALIDEEITHLQNQMKQQGQQNIDNMPRDVFESDATRRVKLGLLISKIIEENDIKLDKDVVQEKIKTAASAYDDPEQYVNYYNQNKQAMASIEALVLEEMVVNWISERATVNETAKSFDEVMKPGLPA
ncbi:MAG: trigger factor [Gammaproteobacteria bacterium]|nr:trigger factor [Gammaproteobacteria bacterium]